jgi:ABC-type branched-subunit amino acid transport system substrate-binding protein
MKKNLLLCLFVIIGSLSAHAQANTEVKKNFKVAIFAPLYLDSAFGGTFYRYAKSFPKFSSAGLEFVHGAQVALDSFNLSGGAKLVANIYDSKAATENITWLINNRKLDSVDLIIGSVKDIEVLQLASFAKKKNIPFVSATAPNDGGVTNNPFFVMLSPTLRSHCEVLHSYLKQSHGMDKIYLCRKKGAQEDKIADYIKNVNEIDGISLLNIEVLNLEDDFTTLASKLDSTKKSVLIGGSLNDDFADGLVKAAYDLKTSYNIEMIGMPNWYTFPNLKKSSLKDFEILYTTAYYNTRSDKYSKKVQSMYNKKFRGTASEMCYKGFESVFLFAKLITKYPNDFTSHLNEISKQAFGEYNFLPVYVKKANPMPDYLENKHLYFMKITNGRLERALNK